MGKVNLEINGRRYALGCDDGEEARLQELGQKLDARIKLLANQFGQIGDLRLLVMAGITMTDELEEVQEDLDGQAKQLSAKMREESERALYLARLSENDAQSALIDAARQIEGLAQTLKG